MVGRGAHVGESNPGMVGLDGGLLYIGYHIRTQPTSAYFKSGASSCLCMAEKVVVAG